MYICIYRYYHCPHYNQWGLNFQERIRIYFSSRQRGIYTHPILTHCKETCFSLGGKEKEKGREKEEGGYKGFNLQHVKETLQQTTKKLI